MLSTNGLSNWDLARATPSGSDEMTLSADPITSPFGAFLRDVGNELADIARHRPAFELAEDRSSWKQLFAETVPVDGESLRGLIVRACRNNGLPNSWGMLQHMGSAYRNRISVSEDATLNPAEIAHALKVSEEEVRDRLYPSLGHGTVSFFGMTTNVKRIETTVRRFSPAALAKATHQRSLWELRDIPFCFEGWDMLQERCWCEAGGIVQRYTRTSSWPHECDKCGDPLSRIMPVFVPQDMRPALLMLRAIVDPFANKRDGHVALPAGLQSADRGRILRTVVRLARALDAQSETHSFEQPAERLRGLSAAMTLLREWPRPIYDLDWPQGTKAGTIYQLCDWWRDLSQATPLPFGARPPKWGQRAKARTRVPCALIGIRPAGELARMSPEQLMAAWNGGHVTAHVRKHGPRRLPAFDKDELIALSGIWHERVPQNAYSAQTGLSLYGLEQLMALNEIVADMPTLDGEPSLRPSRIAEFETRLIDRAVTLNGGTVALSHLLDGIHGRLRPTGAIVARLLSGEFDYQLESGGRLIDRILIANPDIKAISDTVFDPCEFPNFGFTDTITQTDALAVFGGASISLACILDGLPHSGKNPKRYRLADVEDRAQNYVTLAQIARALGEATPSTHCRFRRLGIVAALPGLFCRSIMSELDLL